MINSVIKLYGNAAMIIGLVCCIFASSCTSDEQYAIANSDSYTAKKELAMKNLFDSIDALNEKYPSVQTRGGWYNFCESGTVGLADAAGWYAGAGIGRWVGGAVGGVGGPATAVLGSFVGGQVGPFVCTFLASGTASLFFSSYVTPTTTPSSDNDEFHFVGIVTNKDSIGYYHNCMMTELNKNKDRYIYSVGSIDYDLIYDDIIKYLYEIGKYDEALEDPVVKYNIVSQIRSLCSISEKYRLSSEYEEFINEQCDYLKNKCFLPDEDVETYREFGVKLYSKCSTLSDDQIEDYSKDLNEVIDNSDVPQTMKDDLSLSADLTINSALYWRTNY